MRKIIAGILTFFICVNCLSAIDISAECFVVMDIASNRTIAEKNAHKKRSVASISKIMTAIIVIEASALDKKIVVGSEIDESTGSNIYIEKNEEMTVKDLLYGLMLRSGNDAALVLAKNIGGSVEDFVVMMNKKAQELGMKNTIFNNPHGLDINGGNISTAYDMAILSSYASKNITYLDIVGTKKYKLTTNLKSYLWFNKNKLLDKKYITGGKTGFTDIARRTLVSSANQNNIEATIVTLNDGNDFANHINIYEQIFVNYKNYKLLDKNNFYVKDNTYYNDELYIENNFYYTLTENETQSIRSVVELTQQSQYKNGDIVGVNKIYFKNNLIHEENILVKKQDHEKLNWWQKIKRFFKL